MNVALSMHKVASRAEDRIYVSCIHRYTFIKLLFTDFSYITHINCMHVILHITADA